MGSRSPEFGWYLPDRQEIVAAEVTLRELSTADVAGGTWSPEQVADADKLAGFLLDCGPWAKATAQEVAEQRESLELAVDLPLLEPLAEMYANLDRYQVKRHEWDRQKDSLGLLGGSFTAQLDKCDPIPVAIAAPAASPRPERRKVDAASRRTTTNRPRKTEPDRRWTERERLLKASRSLVLKRGPQQLWAEMIQRADANGTCWASTSKLAAALGVDPRTVRRYRSVLEDVGLLTVDNFRRRNGRQGACTFRLHLDVLTAAGDPMTADHVARADRPDHVTRADRLDTEAAQLVEVAAETLESALRPNVIRADKLSAPEQKSLIKEPGLLEEREALQASPSSFNQCDDRYATARDRATAVVGALIARREAEEAAAPQLQEIVHQTPRLVQALVTASSEAPGHSTSQLVQALIGDGAILAAQALLENPAGVDRCALIAEKKSIQNPAGYLLTMLRQGQHRLTVEEQERSEWSAARTQRHLVAV